MARKAKTDKSEPKGKKCTRYARFWAIFGQQQHIDKDELVLQFTDGRTTHLSQMKADEYNELCDALEGRYNKTAYEQQIKKARSAVLLRVGRLGINTIDNWDEVNAFLLSPKIAGKLLYEMSVEEMKALVKKLEAILRNGGLKSIKEAEDAKSREQLNNMLIPVSKTTNKPKYLS
ncbi:MAG: hypothetical protein IIU68_01465 [Bacteroidales bacterium]|nr:hypothetical protein [Bacteroidales bacterium]